MKQAVLIGNTFPLTLIRRKVSIDLISRETLRSVLHDAQIFSFWGHENTLASASQWLAHDLTPVFARPTLQLNADGYPSLNGKIFFVCYIISPDYCCSLRPAIGVEVTQDKIESWQCLKITWEVL